MPGISGIQHLPYELVAYIVQHLDIEDVFHWSLCCKHFQYIIREDRFCKPIVMTKAGHTLEARDALETGNYSRALRRLVKRRNALSKASPYVVGVVAHADSYGYYNGKLCYIVGQRPPRSLHILDIHKSTKWELTVDIPTLIRLAIPRAASCRKYKFRVLYEAAGIVSCLFSFALHETENWLLIIKPREQRILEAYELESTARIFVRNNEKFLYFGTHSGNGADGQRKWILKGFDLSTLSWLPQPRLHLSEVAGCVIGSTVCFEIFGDYFYGLSNQILSEAEDPEWRSYYYCFRFPLNNPSVEKTQAMSKEDSWRRQHSEGPIDDRWGFLSLEKDEVNGNIVILECRKEWLRGQSGSRRTYYTTEVIFRQNPDPDGQQTATINTARRLGDHPHSDTPIPVRPSRHVHAGDDSTAALLLVRSKTYFCTYIRYCHTFIDLIDETSEDVPPLQRLRLRTGRKILEPNTELLSGNPAWYAPSSLTSLNEASNAGLLTPPPQNNEIFIWPPEKSSPILNSSLEKVQQVLSAEDHQGSVTAAGDERSIIYAMYDSTTGTKTIVLLSFDPATRFDNMEPGGNLVGQRVSHMDSREGPRGGYSASSKGMLQCGPNVSLGATAEMMCSEADGTTNIPSFDAVPVPSADLSPPPPPPGSEGPDCWARFKRAMHSTIRRKFFFGR